MEENNNIQLPNEHRREVYVPEDQEVNKFDVKPYVPLIASLIGLLNFFLVEVLGMEPFPYDVQQVVDIISMILVVVGTIYGWWKNNDVTKQAKKRTKVADQAVPKEKKVRIKSNNS